MPTHIALEKAKPPTQPFNKLNSPSLTILGGGVSGLYSAITALDLGASVTLLEKEDRFGGLAAGHQLAGNWFDLGVHMLHAFDEEVFATCCEAMATERIEVPLKSHIKWGNKIYHYPLRGRDILAGIPPFTLMRCVSGLVVAEMNSHFKMRQPGSDAESALIELYGAPLYRFFFEDFTERYWGIHPAQLSAEFVRRKMPRLSAVDVIKNLLEKLKLAKPRDTTEGALRFETLHYSATGAETLPRSLAALAQERGATLLQDSPVTKICHNGTHITAVQTPSHTAESTHYLSTLPLPQLVQLLNPPPPQEVLDAAAQLRFKPMTIYAFLVKKERCMDALYTYYRDRIFHRVGEPKNAGLKVTPSDHSTLIVETTCEINDAKWTGDALEAIISDLVAEGLCRRDQIASHHLIHATHAYPIFAKGFDEHLTLINHYLSRFQNFSTTGRQGAFCYPNMHGAMRMGADAVTNLLTHS